MTDKPVEYRKPSAPPTEPGWYYGRRVAQLANSRDIEACHVIPVFEGRELAVLLAQFGGIATMKVADYDWFGPVMEVREG